jgi:hypothetical protein
MPSLNAEMPENKKNNWKQVQAVQSMKVTRIIKTCMRFGEDP